LTFKPEIKLKNLEKLEFFLNEETIIDVLDAELKFH
jgi:hypothetical protein